MSSVTRESVSRSRPAGGRKLAAGGKVLAAARPRRPQARRILALATSHLGWPAARLILAPATARLGRPAVRRILALAAAVLGALVAAQLAPGIAAAAVSATPRSQAVAAASETGPVGVAGLPGSRATKELILSLSKTARLAASVHRAGVDRQAGTSKTARRRHRAAGRRAQATFACAGAGAMLPQNAGPIVRFLVGHGYSPMAAAGVAGNIYQESKGNPESVGTGGGGLIGWTPLPAGFVTGNPVADLQTQLQALLTYNQQWAAYIPVLNAATSPVAAADIYMNDFERPGYPAASNREAAASAVAQACGITG